MLLPKRKVNWKLMHENLLKYEQEQKKTIPVALNDKVDEFINWYFENMVRGHYTDIREYHQPIEMRNFIEKMAVWYELRYPDYEINRLMPGSGQENIEIDDVMFNSNRYINEQLDEDSDVRVLDWDEFYNTKTFINSLPSDERCLFQKPRYRNLVYLEPNRMSAHLHLTFNGIVEKSEGLGAYTQFKIKDKELQGMHVKTVVKILQENGIILSSNNELEATVNNAENWIYQKEEMLNCVMYRIIERGGSRIGPRRAFLFAKEFGRNIDIPMMYGVDYSDPGLRRFMNEYIKAGGSKDLICYVGYFSRASKNEKVDIVSMQELIQSIHNDCVTKYTPEETELHQRMVNSLANQIDKDGIKKEEVKQLRLQRKLEKSRKNSV